MPLVYIEHDEEDDDLDPATLEALRFVKSV